MVEWSPLGTPTQLYSTRTTYDILRGPSHEVPWHKEVWFGGGIPKHKFTTWLMVLNRCPTLDRMLQWGLQTDGMCLLCNSVPESRSHLLFECTYSWEIWSTISTRCGYSPSPHWETELSKLQAFKDKRFRKLLLLAWQGSIYMIWAERNNRLHRQNYRSTSSTLVELDQLIRRRIASFRTSNPSLSSKLFQTWFSSIFHHRR